MTITSPESFFLSVLRALEELQIPYFVVGGFAAVVYGISRVTYDVDIVVRLEVEQIPLLTNRYPLPRYYADAEQMQSSLAMGIPFNLIDTQTGEKADLIPYTSDDNVLFERRVRQTITLPTMPPLVVWCASVEDTIVGKLSAWTEIPSRRHEQDILEMVIVALSQQDTLVTLDIPYIDKEADKIGRSTYDLWQSLLQRAQNA